MPLFADTSRLILRPFQDQDIRPFSEYRSDPEVARYQGWEAPFTLPQAAEFIELMKRTQPGTPGQWYQVAIQLKATNELIGDCAFHLLSRDPQQAEIGFTLARRFHGHGYATEAVSHLIAYLFSELGLHRIQANCDEENLASARLLERVGMRREGHFRENLWFKGRWSSEFWYALLRSEWLSRRKEVSGDV